MKTKITTLVCTLLINMAVFSQDVITYRNGIELLNAKIIEITLTEVKYKKMENLSGPIYSSPKADIFMIKYENGTKDVFSAQPVLPVEPVTNAPLKEEKDIPDIRHYGGPRFGVTFAGAGLLADDLSAQGKGNVFSQFGWQFETRMFTTENGISGLLELVPLISMVDMGKFTPSVTGIVGLRGKEGLEFGAGPSFSIYRGVTSTRGSFGMVIALGVSVKSKNACFPVNLAVEPSVTHRVTYYTEQMSSLGYMQMVQHTKDVKTGVKVSVLVGFNSRTR